MVGMVVVGFPVVFIILTVVQILTECIIGKFPPIAIVDIFTLSSVVLWVKYMIHKVSSQDIVAVQRRIIPIKCLKEYSKSGQTLIAFCLYDNS